MRLKRNARPRAGAGVGGGDRAARQQRDDVAPTTSPAASVARRPSRDAPRDEARTAQATLVERLAGLETEAALEEAARGLDEQSSSGAVTFSAPSASRRLAAGSSGPSDFSTRTCARLKTAPACASGRAGRPAPRRIRGRDHAIRGRLGAGRRRAEMMQASHPCDRGRT